MARAIVAFCLVCILAAVNAQVGKDAPIRERYVSLYSRLLYLVSCINM